MVGARWTGASSSSRGGHDTITSSTAAANGSATRPSRTSVPRLGASSAAISDETAGSASACATDATAARQRAHAAT